jgi:REP element-mobilizing transposase RayT
MINLETPPGFRGLQPDLPITGYYRHMPHWRQDGATYFVTFRLGDALPQCKIDELRALRRDWEALHPPPRSDQDWESYTREVTVKEERWMDESHGACQFAEPRFSQVLREAILFFQDQRYVVSCFTIMPNHCHLVIRPFPMHDLERILQVCKGYAASRVNRALGESGTFWQEESFDRIVRDEEHLYKVIQYIGRNPRSAGIPTEQWVRWVHPSWREAGWSFEDERG